VRRGKWKLLLAGKSDDIMTAPHFFRCLYLADSALPRLHLECLLQRTYAEKERTLFSFLSRRLIGRGHAQEDSHKFLKDDNAWACVDLKAWKSKSTTKVHCWPWRYLLVSGQPSTPRLLLAMWIVRIANWHFLTWVKHVLIYWLHWIWRGNAPRSSFQIGNSERQCYTSQTWWQQDWYMRHIVQEIGRGAHGYC